MYNIFDTHTHYTDSKFDIDREKLLKELKILGVTDIVSIGASLSESKLARDLANQYKNKSDFPNIYYTVGEHPDEIVDYSSESEAGVNHINELKKLADNAVAIGEIGLDYYGKDTLDESYKVRQKDWFVAELNMARELNLPFVIHSRDACMDTMDILTEYGKGLKGVIHCFAYEKDIALKYISMGYFIGVGGVLTFKNARKLVETVETVPLEYIVTETDAPYLAPTPHRGERNISSYIKYVIEEISRIKKIDVETCAHILFENAKRLYNIN